MLVPDSQFSQNQTQTQATQPQTQATQPHSQQFPRGVWGVLVSCVPQSTTEISPAFVERPARVELVVGKDSYSIGRDLRCDIVLAGKKISARQARIYIVEGAAEDGEGSQGAGGGEEGGIRLEDTGTNGTYVRGKKVGIRKTTNLFHGDEIVFGPATSSLLSDFRYIFQSPFANPPAFRTTQSQSGIEEFYEIQGSSIGKGSFATVYKAIERSSGRTVAVKVIKKARFKDQPKTMAMLRREIEVMKSLSHKYCVEYLDFFEDDELIMIVMEFVGGGDLLEQVMTRHGLPEGEVRDIARMVCEALAYLHSKGVAHRDIKPENLLLSKGKRPVCKITDFGLAKISSEQSKLKTLCGTPSYLAPEVILGTVGSYDTAVDAFSLGIVLYCCLANSTPFDESESTPLPERMRLRVVDYDELRAVNTSEIGIDFIAKLTISDPALRMTAAQALLHPWLATSKSTKSQKDSALPIKSPAALLTSDGSFGYSNLCLDSPSGLPKPPTIKMDQGDVTEGGTAMLSIVDTSKEPTISALPRAPRFVAVPVPLSPLKMTLDTPPSNKRKEAPSSAFSSSGSSLSSLSSRENSPMETVNPGRTTRRSPRKSIPRVSTIQRDESTTTTLSSHSTSTTVTKDSPLTRSTRRSSAGTPRLPPSRSTPRRSTGRTSVDRSTNGKEAQDGAVEMETSPVVSLRKSTRARKAPRLS